MFCSAIIVSNMAKDVTFQLDTQAAEELLTSMSMPLVQQAGNAVAARARSMASQMSSDPPEITVSTEIGTIKRGRRAIATVKAEGQDEHQAYIGFMAIQKSKDAGRVN